MADQDIGGNAKIENAQESSWVKTSAKCPDWSTEFNVVYNENNTVYDNNNTIFDEG